MAKTLYPPTKPPTTKVLKPNVSEALPADAEAIRQEKMKNPKFQSFEGKYYILSKEKSTMYVMNHNHEVVDRSIVGRGKAVGDYPNSSDTDSKYPGANATTPGGSAVIASSPWNPAYNGYTSILKYNDPTKVQGDGALAIHPTYPEEFVARNKIFADPKNIDKLMSWGCINVPPENLARPTFKPTVGDSVFISNEPERNRLKVQANMKRAGIR